MKRLKYDKANINNNRIRNGTTKSQKKKSFFLIYIRALEIYFVTTKKNEYEEQKNVYLKIIKIIRSFLTLYLTFFS